MAKEHVLDPSPQTVHWGYIGGPQRPALTVDPGDALTLRSVSGDPADPVPEDWISEPLKTIHAEVRDKGPGVHILTGPVWVNGAEPGDTLAVTIGPIRPTAPYGFNYMGPTSGLFREEPEVAETAVIAYDEELQNGFLGRIKVPLRPFFGIVGVAPPESWGRISSVIPGRYGGNMDNKELIEGTTLYLPVLRDGALFYAGDGHGAQGDGEVNVTAIETSLEGRFEFGLIKGTGQRWPYAKRGSLLISMGFDEDLTAALKDSVRQMMELLEDGYGFSAMEAYRVCSLAADFRITQVVNGVKGVHGMLDTSVIAEEGA